jgi:UDP:flavonoid glycosyltransferase YjiC (YdhE family)
LALKERGARPVLAAPDIYRDKIEAEGIEFARLRPDLFAVEQKLKMSRTELVRAVGERPQFLLREMLLPYLRESYDDMEAVMADTQFAVIHQLAFGARLAAEKYGVPHSVLVLQPMAFLSSFDPPYFGPLPRLSRWIYSHPTLTRALFHLAKKFARPWARPIDELRRSLGLPATAAHPFFEGQFGPHGAIGLYSKVLGGSQPDHPPGTSIVGFALYDKEHPGDAKLDPALERFLAEGPPPLVFTLGTAAVHDADDFVTEGLEAVRRLNLRAVFVLDEERRQQWASHASDAVLFVGYTPYSLLFPRARAVIHHGGVGTSTQALRSGKPQLVAPYLVDQPDNAARLERLGVARTLPHSRFRATRIVAELQQLLAKPSYSERAASVGERVRTEDGAGRAADIVLASLASGVAPAKPNQWISTSRLEALAR